MILFNACRRGLTSLIKELLLEGVDPNSVDMAGQTALHIACLYNHIDIVRELLSYGVDINIKDKMGRTPLFCACLFDHKEIVKELPVFNQLYLATLNIAIWSLNNRIIFYLIA